MASQILIDVLLNGNSVLKVNFNSFPILFGRGKQCHLRLPYDFISREHGAITLENDKIVVTDLDSRNGLVIDGRAVNSFTFGEQGLFQICNLICRLQLVRPPQEATEKTLALCELPKTETKVSSPSTPAPSRKAVKKSIDAGGVAVRLAREPVLEREWLNRFQVALDLELPKAPADEVSVQVMISWQDDLYDIHAFRNGESLVVSPFANDKIFLPAINERISLGMVSAKGAEIQLPRDLKWSLNKAGIDFDAKSLQKNMRIAEGNLLMLSHDEIFSVEFGHKLKAHVRYIRSARPFIPLTWIENKEEFRKAIQISMAAHFIFATITLFSVPKSKAPVVENVPQRFARLLVEPPKQFLVTPPPPPLPPPEPEPPKPAPPKIVEKLRPTKVKHKKAREKTLVKVAERKMPQAQAPTVDPAAKKAAAEAAAMANLLNTLSAPTAAGTPPANIKLSKTGTTNKGPGYRVSQVVGSIQNNVDGSPGIPNGPGNALSSVGEVGFAKTGGGKAGKRRVGGIVPEAPTFKGTDQGLTDDQVMKIVNAHLSEIQRCYERALFVNPGLVGRIEYEWTINPKGAVTESSVKRSEMGNADFLNQCVLKVIQSMKFPTAKNKLPTVASIGFPFGRH